MNELYDKLRLLDALLLAFEKLYLVSGELSWEDKERGTYLFYHIQELVSSMISEMIVKRY